MDFDLVLEEVGEFGWWQRIQVLLQWVPSVVGGVHALMFSFTGLQPGKGFRCAIPSTEYQTCDGEDFSFGDFPSDLFPTEKDGETDFCKFYRPTVEMGAPGNCSRTTFSSELTKCPSGSRYSYNSFEFEETLVTRWNLVCDQQYKVPLVISMYMVGLMLGSFVFGTMADKIGRTKMLMVAVMLSSVSSLVGAFIPELGISHTWEYILYCVTRLTTGMGSKGIFLASFNLSLEMVGNKERLTLLPWVTYQAFLGVMIQAPFAIGMVLFTLQAMFTPSWFTLQWTASALTFLQLGLWFVLYESPRWLIASGRNEEATKLVKVIAKKNGRELSQKTLSAGNQLEMRNTEEEEQTKDDLSSQPVLGVLDLLRQPLLKNTLVMFLIWPIVTLGYYGITFSMANLSDDMFMDFILSSLVELPGDLMVVLLVDVVGRKPLFSTCLLLSGTACVSCGFLDKVGAYSVLRRVLAQGGKFFAAGNLAIVYIYTAELYPTIIRSTAVGSCSLMSRIGAIIAPYIALSLPKVTNDSMPYLVMGGFSILGGLLALLLPETLGSPLPETMEDVKKIKEGSKSLFDSLKQKYFPKKEK